MTRGRQETRTALIDASLEILASEGEEPSLRAVARAAGVSAMAPYNHFADKAELMAAVADRGFEALGQALSDADEAADAREALIAQGIAFVAFARANPALFRLMYGHRYGGAPMSSVTATYTILADRLLTILPSRLVPAAALACRSLVQGMATIALAGRLAPATDADIDLAIRLLVTGFTAEG